MNVEGMRAFLQSFPLGDVYQNYVDDPVALPPAEQLSKTSGQVCYSSFGVKRSWNENAQTYIDNIISSGHGSVLEHANFSFLVYGQDRAISHEVVRHRAGMAYSQLSQRFVSGRVLRFVERLEYQGDPELHRLFEGRIDRAKREYDEMAEMLLERQSEGEQTLIAESRTDARKRVNQTARSLLPNEAETFMVITGNVRALRHVINMRANEHAETGIRSLFFNVYQVVNEAAPMLFNDFEVIDIPDGTHAVKTLYPKV